MLEFQSPHQCVTHGLHLTMNPHYNNLAMASRTLGEPACIGVLFPFVT